MSASQEAMPWVRKFFQNFLRSSSVSASARSAVPSTNPSLCRNWDSDISLAWAEAESGVVLAISDTRLDVIRKWYAEMCESQKLCGLPEPIYCPDTIYDRHLGLGQKLVGELLVHIDVTANVQIEGQPASGLSRSNVGLCVILEEK